MLGTFLHKENGQTNFCKVFAYCFLLLKKLNVKDNLNEKSLKWFLFRLLNIFSLSSRFMYNNFNTNWFFLNLFLFSNKYYPKLCNDEFTWDILPNLLMYGDCFIRIPRLVYLFITRRVLKVFIT